MKLQPVALYRAAGQECPNLDYYHADLMENKHNSAAIEAATDETLSCSPGLQMRDVARDWRNRRQCGFWRSAIRMFRYRLLPFGTLSAR